MSRVKSASVSLWVIVVALVVCVKPWHCSRVAFKQQYAKSLSMVVLMESRQLHTANV